jgi:hypothetical protein
MYHLEPTPKSFEAVAKEIKREREERRAKPLVFVTK